MYLAFKGLALAFKGLAWISQGLDWASLGLAQASGGTDERTVGHTKFFPFLQDFVPYRVRSPKTIHKTPKCDRWTDRLMDGPTDRWTDRVTCRVA